MAPKTISTDKFTAFLLKRSEHLDDEIIRSLRPNDKWIGTVSVGPFKPDWFSTVQDVRRISEGVAYKEDDAPDSLGDTFRRFDEVYPKFDCWYPELGSVIGEPCDP